MSICEVCFEDVETVCRCRECDTLFCSECGSVKEELCRYCLEEVPVAGFEEGAE
jgi:hypothetical protein